MWYLPYFADYDAPLSEAGEYTPKYHLLRDLFSRYSGKLTSMWEQSMCCDWPLCLILFFFYLRPQEVRASLTCRPCIIGRRMNQPSCTSTCPCGRLWASLREYVFRCKMCMCDKQIPAFNQQGLFNYFNFLCSHLNHLHQSAWRIFLWTTGMASPMDTLSMRPRSPAEAFWSLKIMSETVP